MSELNPARHESKDVNSLGILIAAASVAGSVLTAFFVAGWGLDLLNASNQQGTSAFPLAEQERRHLPPEPRLDAIDRMEGKAAALDLGTAQQAELESYGWVNKKAGIVRIPLSRAMKIIVADKLLPARSDTALEKKSERGQSAPSAASSGRTLEREP